MCCSYFGLASWGYICLLPVTSRPPAFSFLFFCFFLKWFLSSSRCCWVSLSPPLKGRFLEAWDKRQGFPVGFLFPFPSLDFFCSLFFWDTLAWFLPTPWRPFVCADLCSKEDSAAHFQLAGGCRECHSSAAVPANHVTILTFVAPKGFRLLQATRGRSCNVGLSNALWLTLRHSVPRAWLTLPCSYLHGYLHPSIKCVCFLKTGERNWTH